MYCLFLYLFCKAVGIFALLVVNLQNGNLKCV